MKRLAESGFVRHAGVLIVPDANAPDVHDDFWKRTVEALDFLQRHDPRRFARLQRYMQVLENYESRRIRPTWTFIDPSGLFQLDFCRMAKRFPEDSQLIPFYAAVLVSAATYHHILHRGIIETRAAMPRIARACRIEAVLFLGRLKDNVAPSDLQSVIDVFARMLDVESASPCGFGGSA